MRRRAFLWTLGGGAAVAVGALLAAVAPAAEVLRVAAGQRLRAPADLLARLRRKTKPLDPADLHGPHDLAG